MKTIRMQHEITEELDKRSGIPELKLIRLKGYDPSWELGGTRKSPLDDAAELKLRSVVTQMQSELDMA